METKITVVDSMPGAGKTSWAINHMNEQCEQKFIYITPFLSEIERVKEQCDNRYFYAPSEKRGKGKKTEDFYNLIEQGCNICSTHSLFMNLDSETIEQLKLQNYVLILDETVNVLENLNISKKDLDILLKANAIKIDEVTKKVIWLDEDYQGKDLKFIKLKNSCMNGETYYINSSVMLWSFPVSIFKCFKEVYIMTFLFDGQLQKSYFDMYDIQYEYKSVEHKGSRGMGTLKREIYELTEYKKPDLSKIKELINIYEGKLNSIGDKKTALSNNWYLTRSKADKEFILKLRDNTYSYFHSTLGYCKSDDNMWSTFKTYKHSLKGKGYTKGFVPCNARATNDYRHKKNLAYLCNIYVNPMYTRLFELKGITVDEDSYALDKMIQWIFRSAIRDDQPVNLYLPSSRMRNILTQWLS